MCIHSWQWLELVKGFKFRTITRILSNSSAQAGNVVPAAPGSYVDRNGIHCIYKGRCPETSERERTDKTAHGKCRTGKMAKVKFRTSTGHQNSTICRTTMNRKTRFWCNNGTRWTPHLPTSVTTAECGENQVHADVAWTATDAQGMPDTADSNGVRKIKKNG